MSFINVFLLSMVTLKVFFFLRIYDDFGLLVQLFLQVLSDVTTFTTFFAGWIVIFAAIFQILGIQFDETDYPFLDTFTKYLLYSYRNSIGDINPPLYDFWSSRVEDSPTVAHSMISVVWFAWLAMSAAGAPPGFAPGSSSPAAVQICAPAPRVPPASR